MDSFAKRLNSGQVHLLSDQKKNFQYKSPHVDTSFGHIPGFASTTPSPKTPRERLCDSSLDPNLVESLRAPKEKPIRVAELAELAMVTKAKVSKPEFKWRGQFWTIFDHSLHMSFRRPDENTRQVCFPPQKARFFQKIAAIQLNSIDRQRFNRLDDTRTCTLCGDIGDGPQEHTGRLLNVDANEWVHVNCILWSAEVHEIDTGALTNVDTALKRAKATMCRVCGRLGASLKCLKTECAGRDDGFHIICARRTNGRFIKDKVRYPVLVIVFSDLYLWNSP